MSEVVAVCNQKGGVGKTTTAINLSASLAAAEKKVLLIDLDAQGNATTGLGFDKHHTTGSVYDVLINGADILSTIQSTDLPFLSILPSSPELVGAEIELVGIDSRETCLRRCIESIRSGFDFVIIDCPPSLGLLTLNALAAAESVLIPVQCEYYALEGIADLNRTISLVQKRINPGLRINGIVLTMFDGRNKLSYQVENEIRTHFKDTVFHIMIPRNVRLSEAPSHGKPILLYDVNSKGSLSYFDLARELIARNVKQELCP